MFLFIQWITIMWFICHFVIQAFLVDFLDCMLSCRFGNFLCNRYILYWSLPPETTFIFEDP